jgi:hypothetical protein
MKDRVRKREREREGGRERDREREREDVVINLRLGCPVFNNFQDYY